MALSLLLFCSVAHGQDEQDVMATKLGRMFLEAEAQNWIRTWADQHSPVAGVEGFGGKSMFVIQLLFAADSYAHADTDKERFHAALQGASAYIVYAYAATPAVGLVATAVVMVASIIESSVAGSYAEAMLAIQKDMLKTQERIQDLVFRNGTARAYRLLALLDATQALVERSGELDGLISLDCRERAGDFATLGHCLELLTQVVTAQDEVVVALKRLLVLPDSDIAAIGTSMTGGGGANGPADIPKMAKEARGRIQRALDQAVVRAKAVHEAYDGFAGFYQKLAAAYLIDDALSGVQRLAAVEDVGHRCFVDHSTLAQDAATTTIRLTSIGRALRQAYPPIEMRERVRRLSEEAHGLLESWAQRGMSCPEISGDAVLRRQMELLRNRLLALPLP